MKLDKIVQKLILHLVRQKRFWKEEPFIPGETKIGYTGPDFGPSELHASLECLFDGRLSAGKRTLEFEKRIAEYIGVEYCLFTNSGSSASTLMFEALTDEEYRNHLNPGDEVVVSASSYPTTIAAIQRAGLVPVFVDTEIGSYVSTPETMEKGITEKTKAVLVTHIQGNPSQMDELSRVCREKNVILLEDNCEAFGSEYGGQKTGSFGLMSIGSYYPAHHITTMGEGGTLMTNDLTLFELAHSYRDWGVNRSIAHEAQGAEAADRFSHCVFNSQGEEVSMDSMHLFFKAGYNLKPIEIQAAFGLAQLNRVDKFAQTRKRNFRRLYKGLKKYDNYFILPQETEGGNALWFTFPLTIKEGAGFSRREMQQYLADYNIETRILFGANVPSEPAFYQKVRIVGEGTLPNADYCLENSFLVGCYHALDNQKIDYIIKKIRDFVAEKNNT